MQIIFWTMLAIAMIVLFLGFLSVAFGPIDEDDT